MQNVNTLCIAAQSPQDTHSTYGIVQRTQSDRAADAIRWQRGHFQGALLGGTLRGCTCLKCTNKAAPTKQCTNSPQNTRNTQNLLAEKASHRYAQIRRVWHPAIPTPPITQPKHLWKSVGEYYHAGAAASAAPTKQTERVSHRTRGTHRTFWQRKPPTDRHGYAQIRRVWHPCHTHAANNAT